jgi:uncharacterized protein (DUF433 family)
VTKKFHLFSKEIYLNFPNESASPCAANVDSGQFAFVEIIKNIDDEQHEKLRIVSEALSDIEYPSDKRILWRTAEKIVVLEPSRCFGQPIIDRTSTPTRTIRRAFGTYKSYEPLKIGYGVSDVEIEAALAFEQRFARPEAA